MDAVAAAVTGNTEGSTSSGPECVHRGCGAPAPIPNRHNPSSAASVVTIGPDLPPEGNRTGLSAGAPPPVPCEHRGMEGVLRARGLVKRFRGRVAVGGIDLDVAPGERVALLGPNGAGKTTTLLMLLGAILPDEGSVDIAGFHLPGERSQAMEQVGFAAGYLPLPEKLRVREVLDVFARLSA